MTAGDGPFDRAYGSGVAEEDRTRVLRGPTEASLRVTGGFAVGGCVLTPEASIDPGYVTVAPDGTIASVTARRPEGVPVLDTGGVVVPNLIDLHGHPEFNVFAPWEPPRLFANRYQWRASDVYRRIIRDPEDRLLTTLPVGTLARYAEVRALVGGVTAVQGASGTYLAEGQSLVRHVDLEIFGTHRARAMVDLPADGSPDEQRLRAVVDEIAGGAVDAFYVHLAEGRSDDAVSAGELDRLAAFGALTAATVVIHGTALDGDDLGRLADGGAKLVWSPQSELRLYGQTTRAADALAAGVPLGLGADWLPTGSSSLLAELKVARRVLARQGRTLDPRRLVAMVTSGAAAIAGLDRQLGSISEGRPADLVVLERRHADPWLNVVEAEPAWVDLVCVDGNPCYGRSDLRAELDAGAAEGLERVEAWGKEMLLDTAPTASASQPPLPDLGQLRALLVEEYPQTGPIFA